jgi:hypothetical protein
MNIVCTSKPCDGLLYYSYEYCCYLNSIGVKCHLVIVTHPHFKAEDYFDAITKKYTSFNNIIFNDMAMDGVTLIMGRSMMTHGFLNRENYSSDQLLLLHLLFKGKVLAVYSENHKIEYYNALSYFVPELVVDLCDYEVYPYGEGKPFEKRIYFDIHKPIENDIQFKYLFNGTNNDYYSAAESVLHKYESHGILIYDIGVVNYQNNHIIVPVDNLLGIFDSYVYTKGINDPAPRIIQECKYYNKPIVFEAMNKGAEIYYKRKIEKPNVENIVNEL